MSANIGLKALEAERAAFVDWLSGTYPALFSIEDAEHFWLYSHVSALAWKARAALAAAPAATQEVPYDASLNSLAWKLSDWLGAHGSPTSPYVFNHLKPFLKEVIETWLKDHAHPHPSGDSGQVAGDLFWDNDDPELGETSVHNLVVEVMSYRGLELGDTVEIQRAIRLPNVTVRITGLEDEEGNGDLEWEVVDAARAQQDGGDAA